MRVEYGCLVRVEDWDLQDGNFKVPAGITKIGEKCFADCTTLKVVELPDTVTEIKDWAFFLCESLEEVYMTDSVTSIGDRAFEECFNLKKVRLSNSIETIPFSCFRKCALKEVEIPASVKVIEGHAFACNAQLEKVKFLGNNLKRIEEQAFWECSSLEKVGLPRGLEVIKKGAFFDCDNLKQVFIPDTITVIEDRAFSKCKILTHASVVKKAFVHKNAFPTNTDVSRDDVLKADAEHSSAGYNASVLDSVLKEAIETKGKLGEISRM